MSALFLQKAHITQKTFSRQEFSNNIRFKTLQLFVPNSKRLGATLSECTFFFKKAHVTKKTSSKQTTLRPHDKKNPDRAISEIKNPVYARAPFNEESERFQDEILQLLVPNSKRLGGYTQ